MPKYALGFAARETPAAIGLEGLCQRCRHFRPRKPVGSTLGELGPAAGPTQTVLLAFLHAAVAGQQATLP